MGMQIIPGINCADFECVYSRFKQAQEMLAGVSPKERWVHIDIADGGFTAGHETWRNPTDLANFEKNGIKIELHYMVNEPEASIEPWLNAGISRLIFHLETTSQVEVVARLCQERGIETMLAIGPETGADHLLPYLPLVDSAQVLGVSPGKSGQLFQESSLEKIKIIRAKFPNIIIEVDGGITLEVAKQCEAAGANQLAVTSAIFNQANPNQAFQNFLN